MTMSSLSIIIRPRRDVAGCDPHPRDARVVKHDTEEGKARIARRGRNETAEDQPTIRAEVLHHVLAPRGFPRLFPTPAPIRLINVCEHRAKATDRCWLRRIGAGLARNEERSSVMLLPTGVNRRTGLKALKMVP